MKFYTIELIVFIILILLIVIYRYYIIYYISLWLNRCKKINTEVSLCNNIFLNISDMSAPSNSLRLGFEWETWMEKYIKKYCSSDAVAIDIGAHIGIHTRNLSKYAKHVIAFEPNPKTYTMLKMNTESLSNVTTINAAVGSYTGTIGFVSKDMNCQSEIIEGYDNNIQINVVDLDTFLNNYINSNIISFIKIDVEGHEISAFKGMKHIIQKYAPTILFEDHTGNTINYLKSNYCYNIYKINNSNFIATIQR